MLAQMKPLHTLAAIAMVLSPLPALAKDKPPISLARTGKWEMNYDRDSCHLYASFGEGKQAVLMRMTRFQPTDTTDLTLFGEPVRSSSTKLPLVIRFGSVFPSRKIEAVAGSDGAKVPLVILSSTRFDGVDYRGGTQPVSITPEQEAAITAVDLTLRGKHYKLETGSLGKPMAAMRTCLADLERSWGFDPAVQQSLSRPANPVNYPGDWLRQSDYPVGSARMGHQGLVQFRLDIDEAGNVAGCRVLYRTDPDDFADRTCALLVKRAKLSAALDAKGTPVKSYFIGKVRWTLPGA
jgi:Gram-negative bacterial TonB protein C-terminal